jgi:hypothetical protein
LQIHHRTARTKGSSSTTRTGGVRASGMPVNAALNGGVARACEQITIEARWAC